MKRRAPSEVESAQQRLTRWLRQYHSPEMVRQAELMPLRRDMLTLLMYVRDTKVVGTQSTGNLPLKAVREVTARFVNPPKLESTIGDRTYRLRSEADLWSLYFLHILAEVGGLLSTAPARRWRLTSEGEDFLSANPFLQVSFLLSVWWYEVNWIVAYSFEGMGDYLPPRFNLVVLARLRGLPVGTAISFKEFADRLIEETGLTWGAQKSSFAPMLLQGSIERMVISVLATFDAVERECQEVPLGRGTRSELVAFEITPFGEALLDAVAIAND